MVPVVDAVQHTDELALETALEPEAEDLRDLVGAEAIEADITGALEELVDGKVAAENQVVAVLDLLDGVLAPQPDGLALLV